MLPISSPLRRLCVAALLAVFAGGCDEKAPQPEPPAATGPTLASGSGSGSVLDPGYDFDCGSKKVACSGVLPVRGDTDGQQTNRGALLNGGLEAFAVRVESLRNAKRSIRIQSLIFRADESGLAIANLLKERRTKEPRYRGRVSH